MQIPLIYPKKNISPQDKYESLSIQRRNNQNAEKYPACLVSLQHCSNCTIVPHCVILLLYSRINCVQNEKGNGWNSQRNMNYCRPFRSNYTFSNICDWFTKSCSVKSFFMLVKTLKKHTRSATPSLIHYNTFMD